MTADVEAFALLKKGTLEAFKAKDSRCSYETTKCDKWPSSLPHINFQFVILFYLCNPQ